MKRNKESKPTLTIGKQYIYQISKETDDLRRDDITRAERIVTCIGIYQHHVRFDFGEYTRSLTWFDVGKEIREV